MFSLLPRTRLVSRAATLVAAVAFALAPTAHAQSAYYAGVTTTVGSGFTSPGGVAVDGYGNVYVADPGVPAVYEIEAGTGGAAAGTVNSNSTVISVGSGFNTPYGVAVDRAGNVYVADSGSGKVDEIEAGTGGAATGTVNSSSTVISIGSLFNSPNDVAVDGAGNVYVADPGAGSVDEIEAGTGGAATGTVNLNSTEITVGSGFNTPKGVAVDGAGNVYVADGVGKVDEIEAGTGGAAAGTVNSNSTVISVGSGFSVPQGVAVDGAGNVYVIDPATKYCHAA